MSRKLRMTRDLILIFVVGTVWYAGVIAAAIYRNWQRDRGSKAHA